MKKEIETEFNKKMIRISHDRTNNKNNIEKYKGKQQNNYSIIYNANIYSKKQSLLLKNFFSSIPIKIKIQSSINTDIEIKTKEYGYNNLLIEIYLIVKIKELIKAPINQNKKTVTLREPLRIDIIQGKVSNYHYNIR